MPAALCWCLRASLRSSVADLDWAGWLFCGSCDSGSFHRLLPPVSLRRPRERFAARGRIRWAEAWVPEERPKRNRGREVRILLSVRLLAPGSAKLPQSGREGGRREEGSGGKWGGGAYKNPSPRPPLRGLERGATWLLQNSKVAFQRPGLGHCTPVPLCARPRCGLKSHFTTPIDTRSEFDICLPECFALSLTPTIKWQNCGSLSKPADWQLLRLKNHSNICRFWSFRQCCTQSFSDLTCKM